MFLYLTFIIFNIGMMYIYIKYIVYTKIYIVGILGNNIVWNCFSYIIILGS